MFHPYWAGAGPNGAVPRDMAWRPDHEDKARLRQLYQEFLRDHYGLDDYGEPVYPVPEDDYVPPVEANTTDISSLFVGQKDKEGAGAGCLKSGCRQPANPNNAKRVRNRPARDDGVSKTFPDYGKLTEQDRRHMIRLNDAESVKSESPGSAIAARLNDSLLQSSPSPDRRPISLDASPGRNQYNAVDLESELQASVDEDAARYASSQKSSNPPQVLNLVDDYTIDLATERRVTDRASDEILSTWGVTSQRTSSAPPQLSNGDVEQSIENEKAQEQQDAQERRGTSDTMIPTNDEDFQPIAVKPDVEVIELDRDTAGVTAEGACIATAIMLD